MKFGIQKLFLIVFSLILLTSISFIIGSELQFRNFELKKAEELHQSALEFSKAKLANTIEQIATNKTIFLNLNWGQENSLKKTLQTYLNEGSVDAITLVKDDCQSIEEVKISKRDIVSCFDLTKLEGFNLIQKYDTPILIYSKSIDIDSNTALTIHTQLVLNQVWMDNFKNLATLWIGLGLSYQNKKKESEQKQYLIFTGKEPKDKFIVAYNTSNFFINKFSKFFLSENGKNYSLYLILVLATLLALLSTQYLTIKKINLYSNKLENLYNWISMLNETHQRTDNIHPSSDQYKIKNNKSPLKFEGKIEEIKQRINLFIKEKAAIQELSDRQNLNLSSQIKNLKQEISSLQKTLKQTSKSSSLQNQIAKTNEGLLQTSNIISEAISDLLSIFNIGFIENSKLLTKRLQHWQEGISARGARKFLRSLSETESLDGETNLLDTSLNEIMSASQSITDHAFAAQMCAEKIISDSDSLSMLLQHWLIMANENQSDKDFPLELNDIINSVRNIATMNYSLKNLNLHFSSDQTNHNFHHKTDKSIWVSAIYHIILAIYNSETNYDNKNIYIHFKCKNDWNFLVFTLKNTSVKYFNLENKATRDQLDFATQLLAPYDIHCAPLHNANGTYTFGIRWNKLQIKNSNNGYELTNSLTRIQNSKHDTEIFQRT